VPLFVVLEGKWDVDESPKLAPPGAPGPGVMADKGETGGIRDESGKAVGVSAKIVAKVVTCPLGHQHSAPSWCKDSRKRS
jgi:hypothetical protein